MDQSTDDHEDDDDRDRNAHWRIDVEQKAVQDDAQDPEDQVEPVDAVCRVVLLEDEEIRQEDGRHRRKDRTDEVEEVLELVRRGEDGQDDAQDGGDESQDLIRNLGNQALAADAG